MKTLCIELSCLWISRIKQVLEQNGLLSLFLNQYDDKPPFVHRKLFRSLCDQFHQKAFAAIKDAKSKLRTYSTVKAEIGIEGYLTKIKEHQG